MHFSGTIVLAITAFAGCTSAVPSPRGSLPAAPPRYSTAGFSQDQLAVLKVAETFLQGIGTRNPTQMLDQTLPSGGAALLRNGAEILTTLTGLVNRIPFDSPGEMTEIISGQPIIMVDHDIAMAWTPYEFLINSTVDHVGTDIWSFVKQDGQWLVSGVADNARDPGQHSYEAYETLVL
ncbi:hypothetical protein B0H15DRAFT_942382 [Mycena belliarum]|uniref:Nuclear transport factor 2 family protein n=1 Tax=Mycena belliarum TaxID=1033014 RepID=A0AAD6UNI0_9AGAR|nr:hypothetical protein B0H15DRAFT_942382 [Mycena belliae]